MFKIHHVICTYLQTILVLITKLNLIGCPEISVMLQSVHSIALFVVLSVSTVDVID